MAQFRGLTRLLAPLSGEAFTSYVDRLAAFHAVDRLVMLRYVGMIDAERHQRITGYGIVLDDIRLQKFTAATQLSRKAVSEMLLSSFDGIAIDLIGTSPRLPDLLRKRAVSEWAYFSESHACPHCIRENGGAWQLAWKLPWSFACVKHKCYLIPRCPACKRRMASGRRDRTLTPLFVRSVPKLGHCSNPQPDGIGRLGRSSQPCGYDITSIATTAASQETLRVQMLLNERLSGRPVTVFNNQVSALQYFRDLRSLCAFVLYSAEPGDLGDLPTPESTAFNAFAKERDRIVITRKESLAPRNSGRLRLVYARQESPELMSAIVSLATKILEARDSRSMITLLSPLIDRLATKTPDRWEVIKFFGFSSYLAAVVEESLAQRGKFDRAIGCKSVDSRESVLEFGPQHIPQLLWKDEFEQSMKMFFPSVQEVSARRFCSMALVKLSDSYTWRQSAAELGFPVDAGNRMANRCVTILGGTGEKESFGKALREIAKRLSTNPNKVDYGRRREVLSTLLIFQPNLGRTYAVLQGST